jgi:DNA polymerase-3 subunit delta'
MSEPARLDRAAPMPFSTIVGHTSTVELLRRAVARGRVPQSLLFAGPEGVGKGAVAIALAQAVNCQQPRDGDACGRCAVCVRIPRGQYSDVTLVDTGDAASIKIGALRSQVLATVNYRPFEGRRRVYIIDPADRLSEEAQDALLKTLEEPPAAVILILVSAYPDTLVPTIQSRCRRVRFGPLPVSDVQQILVRQGMAPSEAQARAAVSGGSVTRALAGDRGTFEQDRDAALAVLRAAGADAAVAARLKSAEVFARHPASRRAREAVGSRLAILQSLLRDLGAIRAGIAEPLAHADLEETLRRLAPVYDVERVSAGYAAVTQALVHVTDDNASPKIVADWTAMAL